MSASASRCDTSPAWLSWIGARAAIALIAQLPATDVEQHCLTLADAFREESRSAGAVPAGAGLPSHIVAVQVPDPQAVRAHLQSGRVHAQVLGDRLRVGFHYFNNQDDVRTAVRILAR